MDARIEDIVQAIHATPHRAVLEFAGAGAPLLAWLHSVGGSSRTVLEASDRYSPRSLIGAIGFEPDQFVAPGVAHALAAVAYARARGLAPSAASPIGLGWTAAVASDRSRRGAHRCFVATLDAERLDISGVELEKGARSRPEEEEVVARLALDALARRCGVDCDDLVPLLDPERISREAIEVGSIAGLVDGAVDCLAVRPGGARVPGGELTEIALVSGSFNPLHEGHRKMAEAARLALGREVYFELPLVNADKAAIGLPEVERRLAQFTGDATVLLTRLPLFRDKAGRFPGSVFVLGADTLVRLLQSRFYGDCEAGMLASLDAIRAAQCRFLVAGRRGSDDARFVTSTEIAVPAGYEDLFQPLPEKAFRVDLSSTALRARIQGRG